MQPELFEPSWPLFHDMSSSWNNQVEYCSLSNMEYSQVGGSELYSELFPQIDCHSEISSTHFSSTISGQSVQFPAYDDHQDHDHDSLQVMPLMEDFPMDLLEAFEPELSGKFEAIYGCLLEESVGSLHYSSPSSSMKSDSSSMDVTSVQPVLILPEQDMEIENELGVFHLLRAYGEAIEKEQRALEEVILRCISDKVSPIGKPLERVGFILSQQIDSQCIDYLKQESLKNSNAAFKAFCQFFPYVKFAQFTANSAILEATPDDADTLHIVDFDMREGLQWSQMIEAAARGKKALKLTSIKLEEEEEEEEEKEADSDPLNFSFEETKRQLRDHAGSFGLELKIEEIRIEDLVSEVKKAKKRGGGREFLAFNCGVGMSHIRSTRSRKLVIDFLNVAKDLLSSNKGMIVLADGEPCENLKNSTSFSQFFDGHVVHYQALLDSMESTFPAHLSEARMTMETLFVAPFISSLAWSQRWEEIREGFHLKADSGLKDLRLSKESLMEAKEMVRENSFYEVRSEGLNGNEASLNWKGVPLVRVSAWTN
ncbi:protein NODULATION SIGNALING PATHWAY 2-like [Humulus lupulus]|uniref:protein NODULATION SIGNALING PATHWAY 2-like n=1 Tax=Humulus lupulus TaxID=3486 RepID=UPI002B4142B0|nr:protein NODULATION SIGNALING PATHWAY 2-like [Humulus lupulus]